MQSQKNIKILLFSLILFISPALIAQNLSVQSAKFEHNDKMRSSIQVNLYPNIDEVKEAWEDYLKDNHDVNLRGNGFLANKDLLSAEQVVFNDVSSKEMDFFTHFKKNESGTTMNIFASFGYDIYVNPNNFPREFQAIDRIARSFLKSYLPNSTEEKLEEEKEILADLRKEKEDLKDDIADNKEDIQDLKEENEELNEELLKNAENIQEKENLIQSIQRKMNNLSRTLSQL